MGEIDRLYEKFGGSCEVVWKLIAEDFIDAIVRQGVPTERMTDKQIQELIKGSISLFGDLHEYDNDLIYSVEKSWESIKDKYNIR